MQVQRVKIVDKCPKCGNNLVQIISVFDPFPGEKGSSVEQTTNGCSQCGWQKVICRNADYDPYQTEDWNRERENNPAEFSKEDFKVDMRSILRIAS